MYITIAHNIQTDVITSTDFKHSCSMDSDIAGIRNIWEESSSLLNAARWEDASGIERQGAICNILAHEYVDARSRHVAQSRIYVTALTQGHQLPVGTAPETSACVLQTF